MKKVCHPLTACFFSDAGMENFDRPIIDLAADCPDAIAISTRFIAETAQEFPAFRRQSKRDRNHCLLWLCIKSSRSILLCRRLDDLHNEALLSCSRGRLVRRSFSGGG